MRYSQLPDLYPHSWLLKSLEDDLSIPWTYLLIITGIFWYRIGSIATCHPFVSLFTLKTFIFSSWSTIIRKPNSCEPSGLQNRFWFLTMQVNDVVGSDSPCALRVKDFLFQNEPASFPSRQLQTAGNTNTISYKTKNTRYIFHYNSSGLLLNGWIVENRILIENVVVHR